MKTLEINNNYILYKDKIEKKIEFESRENILEYIYEIFSEDENIGEIDLKINIQILEEDELSIKELIKSKNGYIYKKLKNRYYKLFLMMSVLFFVMGIISFIFVRIHYQKRNEKYISLKKDISNLKKELKEKNDDLKNVKSDNSLDEIRLENIAKNIDFILLGINPEIKLKSIEIRDRVIFVEGVTKALKNLEKYEKYLRLKLSKNLKYDYVKKEGGEYLFLIELEKR